MVNPTLIDPWGGEIVECNYTSQCRNALPNPSEVARVLCDKFDIGGKEFKACTCYAWHSRYGLDCFERSPTFFVDIGLLLFGAFISLWYLRISIKVFRRTYIRARAKKNRSRWQVIKDVCWTNSGITLILATLAHFVLLCDTVFRFEQHFVKDTEGFRSRDGALDTLFLVGSGISEIVILQVPLTWLSSLKSTRTMGKTRMRNLRRTVFAGLTMFILLVTCTTILREVLWSLGVYLFAVIVAGTTYLYAGLKLRRMMGNTLTSFTVQGELHGVIRRVLQGVKYSCYRISFCVPVLVVIILMNIAMLVSKRDTMLLMWKDYTSPFVKGGAVVVLGITVGTATSFVQLSESLGSISSVKTSSNTNALGNTPRLKAESDDPHASIGALHSTQAGELFTIKSEGSDFTVTSIAHQDDDDSL